MVAFPLRFFLFCFKRSKYLFSSCPREAQITTCAYQEINIPIFADVVLWGEEGKSLGALPVTLPQVYTLFRYTIFILFLLCFQREEYLGCDYYSL